MFGNRMIVGISVLTAAQWALTLSVAAEEARCFTFALDAGLSSFQLGPPADGVEPRTGGCAGLDVVAENAPRAAAISLEQRARLDSEITQLPADLRARFDERYRNWRKTWERPDILVSSNSGAVRNSEAFRALVSHGPQILPLVVDKLLQPDEFFALQLYDVLQDRPEWREDEHRDQGEQRRALATARRWLPR
jgi:hypothetical protein